jgi:hypothetical protein
MHALLAPTPVQEGLREIDLNLPPIPAPAGPQAPPLTGPPPGRPRAPAHGRPRHRADGPEAAGCRPGGRALAAAADIQALHASSSGIQVVKDGKPIATIDSVTIRRGAVKIDHVSLLGEAAEAADTESAFRVLFGGIAGYVESGGCRPGSRSAPRTRSTRARPARCSCPGS